MIDTYSHAGILAKKQKLSEQDSATKKGVNHGDTYVHTYMSHQSVKVTWHVCKSGIKPKSGCITLVADSFSNSLASLLLICSCKS